MRLVTPQTADPCRDSERCRHDAPACFAVQLVWSVSPIDVARLPHLAIFDAYTLYNVEGNRHGRKWYGVRLGFFSDPTGCCAVRQLCRSDYRAVVIVPVAAKERDGAGGGDARKPRPAAVVQQPSDAQGVAEPWSLRKSWKDSSCWKTTARSDQRDLDDKPAAKKLRLYRWQGPLPRAARAAKPQQVAGKPAGKRVVVRKRTPPRPGAPNPRNQRWRSWAHPRLTLDEGARSSTILRAQPLDRSRADDSRAVEAGCRATSQPATFRRALQVPRARHRRQRTSAFPCAGHGFVVIAEVGASCRGLPRQWLLHCCGGAHQLATQLAGMNIGPHLGQRSWRPNGKARPPVVSPHFQHWIHAPCRCSTNLASSAPVRELRCARTEAGGPAVTTRPPAGPASGPRSMIQSAWAISPDCAHHQPVLPASTSGAAR